MRVRPCDRSYLRFLWWPDGNFNSSPEEFQMTVHLFGATSSPSCANFALRKTAKDNATESNSQAVETVLKNFYVDEKSIPETERATLVKTLDFDDVLTERTLGVLQAKIILQELCRKKLKWDDHIFDSDLIKWRE